eukprot:scaffold55961_cov29-Tisochrysis_lutea.AAC.3
MRHALGPVSSAIDQPISRSGTPGTMAAYTASHGCTWLHRVPTNGAAAEVASLAPTTRPSCRTGPRYWQGEEQPF